MGGVQVCGQGTAQEYRGANYDPALLSQGKGFIPGLFKPEHKLNVYRSSQASSLIL